LATAIIFPQNLVVHATAFASPVLINALGPIGAPGVPVAAGANSGSRDSFGYTLSPELLFRLGNFAASDATITQSALFLLTPRGPTVNQSIPSITPPTELLNYSVTE